MATASTLFDLRRDTIGSEQPRDAVAPAVRFAGVRAGEALSPADWDLLVVRAAEPNVFAERWFLEPSLRHFGRKDIRLAEVRRGEDLIGLAFLGTESRYGRIPLAHVQNWRHHHLFLGSPLVETGAEKAFWTALLTALDAAPWAPNFFHVAGLAEDGAVHRGLSEAAAELGRPCPIVYREERAFLKSDLGSAAYFERSVRAKKRKELRRLRNRLGELGAVTFRSFGDGDNLDSWCDDFLALERSGWKGQQGSALACTPGTTAFFKDVVAGAYQAGRLQFLRMDLDRKAIAMLVNFLAPPGSFSFKTAFDEAYARFSPGVLIQIENLGILDHPAIAWMDSCAAADHPMIDSIWTERRSIVRLSS